LSCGLSYVHDLIVVVTAVRGHMASGSILLALGRLLPGVSFCMTMSKREDAQTNLSTFTDIHVRSNTIVADRCVIYGYYEG